MRGCVEGGRYGRLLARWEGAEMKDKNQANEQRRMRLAGLRKVDRL